MSCIFFADVLKFLSTSVNGASETKTSLKKRILLWDTQTFISASGSGRPCPCEPQTQLWTLNWSTYPYRDTAEGTKQTAHLQYWFRV